MIDARRNMNVKNEDMISENGLKFLKINLQLFADDEDLGDDDEDFDDIDPDDYSDGDETDIDDSDDADDDIDEKSDVTDEDGDGDKTAKKRTAKETDSKPKDKITHALIKQKQVNKELKSKLDLLEQKDREAEQQNRRKSIVDKLVEKGYDEDEALVEAEKQLENEAIKNTVEKLEFMTENAELMAKYPQAKKNVDKLIKLQKSTGWSLDKICRVEYAVTENAFDSKVKSDQESRLKQKKRPSATPVGGQTPIQSVKLDNDDEKAFQFYAKKNPGVSRKQYAERLNQASAQKIPHDKWD